jgi:hypothetical protein
MIGLSDSAQSKRRHSLAPLAGWFLFGRDSVILPLLVTPLFLVVSGLAQAASITAFSPSLADVKTAVSSAVDGDTVVVPAGTASWTSTLVVSKAITLIGATTTDSVAGTAVDNTIIQDDVVRDGSGNAIIISIGANARLSGFTFIRNAANPHGQGQNGGISVSGTITGFRIDHCNFNNINQLQFIICRGWTYGVIDHNLMTFNSNAQSVLIYHQNFNNGGAYGDGSWAAPTSFGSEKFVFIEDNYLNNTTTTQTIGDTDCFYGGRYVFRHNHCYNVTPNSHGTEGRFRGSRAIEVYNNDFQYTFTASMGQLRGGTAVWHDNTWSGKPPASGVILQAYRPFQTYKNFAGASGNNPWDINDTTNHTGNGFSGGPNGLYASGTVSSSGKGTVTVTGATWAINQWAGYGVSNLSQIEGTSGLPWSALIVSNTSNTLTYLLYDTPPVFSAGNSVAIYRVLTSLDQPGRGQGDLITGVTPLNSTTGTATWPHDALEPVYSWNNLYNGVTSVNLALSTEALSQFQANRDYYNNTVMPGYTPYTYPHPLVASAPAPPTNLRAVP